ncbi:MAG: Twin arginine-targeting protein translocase TatC [Candidatus Gottesmanbacteria bacterium GW2011_GWB1_44_11c]|uniref:Twin arginine-targeting protein translocase TatC n=1 Tax=Candidatus Gottesmanbacteria bacterium GW2011_GWB1_44_11c TaxID=1618447 RepID=A0A0G1GK96_9BACT|nr:MAG: Twin arginine-targeting protein translocase TatC [Candidatus Gottesmanbacteria bacterium GW2011_GWB1_44_11c]
MSTRNPIQASSTDVAVTRFLPYLVEIQRKLYVLLAVIFASGVLGFIYYQRILSFVLKFFNLKGITIVLTSPYQFLDLAVNTGIATGVITAFPLIIIYALRFLKPALKPKEYRLLLRLVPVSLLLFVTGFAFGAWVMQFVINLYSQAAIDFNIGNIWDISLSTSRRHDLAPAAEDRQAGSLHQQTPLRLHRHSGPGRPPPAKRYYLPFHPHHCPFTSF